MALQFWHARGVPEKRNVLTFEGGYHGDTLGCVGAAFVPAFHAPFRDALPESPTQLPWPDAYRGACGVTGQDPATLRDAVLEAIDVRLAAPDIAAVLVEPMVQGVAGMRVMPAGFMRGLRKLCDEHEVATGFGRTGALFACDHESVVPDIMALGKGITGGYLPLAATVVQEHVHEAFTGAYAEGKQFFHGHSYAGNNLACAAAIASLDLLEADLPGMPNRARWLEDKMRSFTAHEGVGAVHGLGFMHGIELVSDVAAKTPFAYVERAAWPVYRAARERGLLARPYGNTCYFLPPVTTPKDEIEVMLELYHGAFRDAAPALRALAMPEISA